MQNKEITTWQDKEALRRYITIMPLLEPDIDEGKKRELREKIAAENGLSTRTVYRYEKSYNEGQFQGLKPVSRAVRKHKGRPENFDEIINEAIQLKKEVPRRSIRQIIKILELEGWAEPGLLKKSTLQRYLFNAGFGRKQMQRYVQSRESSCKCQYMNVQKVENKNVHFIRHSSFEFGSKSTFLSLSLYDGPFIDTTVE